MVMSSPSNGENVTETPRRSPRKRVMASPSSAPSSKKARNDNTPSPKSKAPGEKEGKSIPNETPSKSKASSPSTASKSTSSRQPWLHNFSIPSRWEPSIQQGLENGFLTPKQKSALTRQLCMSLTSHTNTVYQPEREHVALLLVEKYPFLKGSFGTGHQFWVKKINERLLNLKRAASRNARKEADDEKEPKGKPGRKKKSTLFDQSLELPSIPDGETLETMQEMQNELVQMNKSGIKDNDKQKQLMGSTFPLRRRELLTKNLRVWEICKQYPPFGERKGYEIKSEMCRILGQAMLIKDVKERYSNHKSKILAAIKMCKQKEVREILSSLEVADSSDDAEMESRCIMAALPIAVGEKKSGRTVPGELFWKIVEDNDDAKDVIEETTSPRLVSTGNVMELHSLCLVAEGMVVCNFKPANSIVNAVITLMASYYAFNSSYPIGLARNVYEFLEFMLLDNKNSSLSTGADNFITSLR